MSDRETLLEKTSAYMFISRSKTLYNYYFLNVYVQKTSGPMLATANVCNIYTNTEFL